MVSTVLTSWRGKVGALYAHAGLRMAAQRPDDLLVVLNNARAVIDDPFEVGDLLVAHGPVGMVLPGEVGEALAGAENAAKPLGVVTHSDCGKLP